MNRRSQVIAAILLVVAAAAVWLAARMTWATVYAEDGMSEPRTFPVHGSDWSPWLLAVAIVLLAAVPVQFFFRGVAARIVAVLVALVGVAVAIPAISLLTSGDNNLYAARVVDVPARYEVVAVTAAALPGAVLLAAAVCAVAGAVAMLRSGGGARRSTKYTTPAARRAELERRVFAEREQSRREPAGPLDGAAPAGARDEAAAPTERDLWDSLDHGVDPTADPAD